MSSLTDNLTRIYNTKLSLKSVLETDSDIFEDYPEIAAEKIAEGGSGLDWDDVAGYGYIIPAGTINLNSFSVYDVAGYAYANTINLEPSGSYSISENGNYNISTYATVNVNVSGGGASTYSISSAYMYDMTMQNVGNYTDAGTYMAYSFTLDSMNQSIYLGSAVNINNTYNCASNFGIELNSVEGNGSYTSSMNVEMHESTSGTGIFSIAGALMEQPNLSVDFLIKLYKNQGLYGFPVDIDYTVSGFVPLVLTNMSYSLDGGMNYQSMSYDSTNNSYYSDFGGMNITAPSSQNVIVKAEYSGGTVKYLSASISMADYGSPVITSGSWQPNIMTGQVYIDNMTGTTDKDITSFIVTPEGNITVNFTDYAPPTPSENTIAINYLVDGVEMSETFTHGQEVMMTFDTGYLSFTDQDGNSLSADGAADYYIDMTGSQSFDVFSTASPVNVVVNEAGTYYVYASYNDITLHWNLSFTADTPTT